MPAFLQEWGVALYDNLIAKGAPGVYASGLLNTIILALGATLIGVILGALVAIVKVYAVDNRRLRPIEWLCNVYLTVIRGTPMMVQLMIMYYAIFSFAPLNWAIPIAILSFGINSGAYVAEIIRAGILSIDRGQMEAGRSLGMTKNQTMRFVILPQAIKNILPALFNEFIVLIKETAIVNIVAVGDLTKAALNIRSRTFNAWVPLFFIALVYLLLVTGLSALQKRLERRLAVNDQR